MKSHFEANGLSAAPAKKARVYVHRCPVCDKFKKIVEANCKNIYEQISYFYDAYRKGESITFTPYGMYRLAWSIDSHISRIRLAYSIYKRRLIQNMTDEELEKAVNEEFTVQNRQPLTLRRTCNADQGETKPELTLLRGGKDNSEPCRQEGCNL